LAALFTSASTKPDPICTESVPTLTGGSSYLNTAAASEAGCRVMGTVASDTAQSQVAEGTPPKGCEAESALVRSWGWGETACPSGHQLPQYLRWLETQLRLKEHRKHHMLQDSCVPEALTMGARIRQAQEMTSTYGAHPPPLAAGVGCYALSLGQQDLTLPKAGQGCRSFTWCRSAGQLG